MKNTHTLKIESGSYLEKLINESMQIVKKEKSDVAMINNKKYSENEKSIGMLVIQAMIESPF